MKSKVKSVMGLAILSIILVGCGPIVEVPPAHVAKRSTASGLQEGLILPGKIRLGMAIGKYDNLILAQTADMSIKESMPVYMPKDQLNLTLEVRGVISVSPDEKNVEKLFARVVPKRTNKDRVTMIDMDTIYETYGQNPLREVSRVISTKYSIDEIMANRERIGQELFNAVKESLQNTPLTVIEFGFADLQPPQVVVTAQETKKTREVEILRAEADKAIALQKAEAALAVAIKQQEVDLKEAETQVLVDKKLAEGVSEAFVMQRALRVWDNLSTNDNKTIIILPAEAIRNPSIMMGVMNKAIHGSNVSTNN